MVARPLSTGSPDEAPAGEQAPRLQIAARYQVVAELGRGGMARVYRVIDAANGGELALKQLLRQEDPQRAREAAELFEREFRTLAQLSHPRVIAVYDYGLDAAGPYYTMELLGGSDLRERSPMHWTEACERVFDVCSSLALLHSRRLVHRDVSPRNVRCMHDQHAKLIDFGAMVPMSAHAPPVGTPPFVAPEVVHGSSLDARTDLYSLGNTLYFALTGQFAYPAGDFSQLIERWMHKPQRPSALVADLPPALDQLVMSLIALEPALRPRSAFEVMERLASLADIQRSEPLSVSEAYLVTPALVGREELLATFREHLQRARHGRGCALIAAGASGSGRSRMLDTCALEGQMLGACVIRTDASGGASNEFAAASGLAERMFEALPEVAVAAARAAGSFETLFAPSALPSGAADRPANDTRVELRSFARPRAERPALQRALHKWFVALSKHQPIMLVVDDADRIDESSVALLVALAVRARRCALLTIVSIERAAVSALAPPIELLHSRSTTLDLRALEPAETEELLSSVFGDVPNLALLSARIHAVAAGSPRQTMELAQHLVDRGAIRFEGSGWSLPERLEAADLPASAEDALRARVAALTPLARRLAEAHALSELNALTREEYRLLEPGERPEVVDDAVDRLVAQQILVTDGLSCTLAQRSAARVLASELDPQARRARHLALGVMYEQTHKHGLATARHLLLAGQHERGFALLMPLLMATKDRIQLAARAELGFAELAETLELGLRLAISSPRPAREEHELRHWLGLWSVMGFEDLYWLSAPKWLAQLELDSGLTDWRALHHVADGSERLMSALSAASERHRATSPDARVYPPDEAIRLLVHYVVISIAIGARTLDMRLMLSLPELLEPFAPLSPLVDAIRQNAIATIDSTCFRRGERACARWAEVYERMGTVEGLDPQIVDSIRYAIAFGIGVNEAAMGLEHALQWAAILDQDTLQRVNAMYLRKTIRLQQGDLEGAERYRKQAELLALQSNEGQMFTNLLTLELNVHAAAWDLTGVKHIGARIAPLADRHAAWRAFRHLAEAHYRRLRGDLAEACAAYERCLELSTPDPNDPARMTVPWTTAASAYVEALIELDRVAEAKALGERTLRESLARGLASASHEVSRALALAEAKLGEYEAAVPRLEQVIAEQLAMGASGLFLGSCYEARARVAIWAGDRPAVERFASLTAEQYRHGRGSPLGARYEHLMDEARSAGVMVLPPLSPFESTILGNTELGARGAASSAISSALSSARDRSEHARRALQLLCDEHKASGGHLFLVVEGELQLMATLQAPPPDELLHSLVADFWSQQSDDADPDTAMLADSTGASHTQIWSDNGNNRYQPRLVYGKGERGPVYAGVALLTH